MTVITYRALFFLGAVVWSITAQASGPSGGLTLLEAPGARAASVAEAFSAASDDITAAAYNPAALSTLSGPQFSFTYQSGIADDASGRVDAGIRNLGLSAAYYSAGDVDLLEAGAVRTVNAQTDLAVSLGTALRLGRVGVGVAAKFLTSQLAEADRATAWAGDAGLTVPTRFFRFSTAIQNIGTRLTYVESGDRLPRIARSGVEVPFRIGGTPVALRAEAPYFLNEQEWRPAAGLEVRAGPLSFRAGYRSKTQLEGLTLGTGFSLGALTLDYAFGFVDDLDARQRLSVVFRFRPPELEEAPFVRRARKRTAPENKSDTQAPGPWRMRMGDIK